MVTVGNPGLMTCHFGKLEPCDTIVESMGELLRLRAEAHRCCFPGGSGFWPKDQGKLR